ncbi:MAG: hypothetical protein WA977_08295 [Halobacteriota archaeon]
MKMGKSRKEKKEEHKDLGEVSFFEKDFDKKGDVIDAEYKVIEKGEKDDNRE